MDLDELQKLQDLNELDLIYKITDLVKSCKNDAEKVIKNNNTASIRLRESMQDVRLLCEIIRDKVQIRRCVPWGDKRKFALDKAIEEEKIRLDKERQMIEKKKQERIDKLNQQ